MAKFSLLLSTCIVLGCIILGSCSGQRKKYAGKNEKENLSDGRKIAAAGKLPGNEVTPRVNLFIENSGSMDGYISGNTNYKDALTDLLVDLKYFYGEEKMDIYFVCDSIYPSKNSFNVNFAHQLFPGNSEWKQGNRGSTSLNSIVKLVLNTKKENEISILVSDCIYSIKGDDTEGLLTIQKSLTKDAFLTVLKKERLVCTVVKLLSDFNGSYYDKREHPTLLSGAIRPYYIWIIGNEKMMSVFNEKINFRKFKEYNNSYIITETDSIKLPYYSILSSSYTSARFRPVRSQSGIDFIHGIEGIKLAPNGGTKFKFGVALDLTDIPVENDYKMAVGSYTIAGNYIIDSIIQIEKEKIHPSDWIRMQSHSPTHVFIISSKTSVLGDLILSMNKKIPDWIFSTSTIDDTNILNYPDKTFGLQYLVEGVEQAYYTKSKGNSTFFTIPVQVKKATNSPIFGKILLVLILAGVAVGIYFIISKLKNS